MKARVASIGTALRLFPEHLKRLAQPAISTKSERTSRLCSMYDIKDDSPVSPGKPSAPSEPSAIATNPADGFGEGFSNRPPSEAKSPVLADGFADSPTNRPLRPKAKPNRKVDSSDGLRRDRRVLVMMGEKRDRLTQTLGFQKENVKQYGLKLDPPRIREKTFQSFRTFRNSFRFPERFSILRKTFRGKSRRFSFGWSERF